MVPSTPSLDRLLALLIAVEVATGGLTLVAGTPSLAWVFAIHGLVAGALLLSIGLKLARSVPRALAARRRIRLSVASAVTLTALGALAGGWIWVAAGRPLWLGSWTLLTIHAWAGLLLVPLVVVHLLPGRWRLLRAGPRAIPEARRRFVSRRALLASLALVGVSLMAYSTADILDRALGGERRFTGSRALPPGGVPPSTTFLGDTVPPVDMATWAVRVHGAVTRDRAWSLGDLASLGEVEAVATLDCTSGWAMTRSASPSTAGPPSRSGPVHSTFGYRR